eukprot:CAMPEP_0196743092 /NCGR_PEP_ID=MMETSP1091-20130531/50668_1 /TAXON_ID=302021 /ORGANISM="Rhodomonas sp., Strain CCMP768" /LENGTH=35 /DNA_ID= /DNA_START= /DNA_END= /DNA_ORIENTATION=
MQVLWPRGEGDEAACAGLDQAVQVVVDELKLPAVE